jgi:hypothetical protein
MATEPGGITLMVDYLRSHPLAGAAAVVIAIALLGSIIRRLVRLALLLLLLLLAGLYWTHREAATDWQTRADLVRREAEALGREALSKGERLLQEGKRQLDKTGPVRRP